MRILIAPDKFKGTLSAAEAAAAMRRGVERAASELGVTIEVDECPVADGGEGTLDTLRARFARRRLRRVTLRGAERRARPVVLWMTVDPTFPLRDRPLALRLLAVSVVVAVVAGAWLAANLHLFGAAAGDERPWLVWTVAGATLLALSAWWFFRLNAARPPSLVRAAYIEVAQAIGPSPAPSAGRDPERVSSAPVGELIRAAAHDGCGRILVGLGGTASLDGGIGAAKVLGIEFNDGRTRADQLAGEDLPALTRVRASGPRPGVRSAEFIALCDVANPLLGPTGAARMFGPQKGATPEQVERLEKGLANLVRVCREAGLPCEPNAPGAGAAGGLGFGLATFLGATLAPGAKFILDLIGFDDRLRRAGLVLTGEGRMDDQTALGKAPAEVARRAGLARIPCIAIVGATDGDPEALRVRLLREGIAFDQIVPLSALAGSPEAAARDAARFAEEAAYRAVLRRQPSNAGGRAPVESPL